ncbi:hypothetical protein HKCCE4037_11570 [Rhodobacterales bacterium HKCCE4037]|nr:hypothetical protein [Rhodobacterales bacterium HKCCE4037]
MIDELILHIGMPKTGTTSIQRALHAARRGEDWTYLDLNPPHSANPVILRAHGGLAPVSLHPGPRRVRSPEAAHRHMTRALEAVRTGRAILSAEAMVRLPPAAVASLLSHLSRHARTIRAVAYVRPPYSFITSYVQQFYKTGHAPLENVLRRAARPITADIAMWEHALGADRVSLFPFAREAFSGASVVRHFAEALALGTLPEQTLDANVSLGDEATRLLYQFRRRYPVRANADGRILFRLAKLEGQGFQLHPDCFGGFTPTVEATHAWARSRMGWDMDDPAPMATPRAVATDAGFDDILPETLDWLAKNTARPMSALNGDPDAIADAVRSLRDRPTLQGIVGRVVRQFKRA